MSDKGPTRKRTRKRDLSGDLASLAASTSDACPIVGIGASAGGLEATSLMLEHLGAETGFAFVLVQHLDPTHASLLTSLLAKRTPMSVEEASDGVRVLPDHVYVIPPNRSLAISRGALRLLPRSETRGRHMAVDSFFRSLADDQGARAIGVVLSGADSDGSLGVQAIKAAGGITYAQDVASAKYDGMPRAAFASGAIDFVLSPADIGEHIQKLAQHPFVRRTQAPKVDESLAVDGLKKIVLLLRDSHGVDFSDYKEATLTRRITRRMALRSIENLEDYFTYLRSNSDEVRALFEDLLINVTSFFRDPNTFDALKVSVFPKILENRTSAAPVRMWVNGCSTGEEAYSLAMCWLEAAGEEADTVPAKIFATDVNDTVVGRARAGIYPENIARDVSPERLKRFFVKVESGYQVNNPVRDMCVFARQNVIKDPPFSRLDLICCRNVLIYLESVIHRKLMPIFHYALNPGGFLMLGSSETIGPYSDLFAPVDKKNKLYVKKSVRAVPAFGFAIPGEALEPRGRTPSDRVESRFDVEREADRILSKTYGPPGVLVRSDLEILQFRGYTDAYLAPGPGEASLNLLAMTRPSLLPAVRAAIKEARQGETAITRARVLAHDAKESRNVLIRVLPIQNAEAAENHFLILFEEEVSADQNAVPVAKQRGRSSNRKNEHHLDAETVRLEQELEATREYLQSVHAQYRATTEDLSSANEEIQSANEELQSINEELETAKEELQATNEELNTVNDELINRNIELSQVNDDLINLLDSTNIPILILTSDLRVRRFTPMAGKTFSLIPTDVGRPIGDLKSKLSIPDLEPLLRKVLDTLRIHEQEVHDREGQWYSMRIRPYRTSGNRIDGVVLTLVDIDAIKKSGQEVETARDYAEAIVDTVRAPLLILGEDLRVRSANRSFYRDFKVTRADTENRFIYDLGEGEWNIPSLRLLLERILSEHDSFEDYVVEHTFPRLGKRTMLLNARRLLGKNSEPASILLAFEDRTMDEKE